MHYSVDMPLKKLYHLNGRVHATIRSYYVKNILQLLVKILLAIPNCNKGFF